jgi:glycosyltransferase involved in cell wall biosynthesis
MRDTFASKPSRREAARPADEIADHPGVGWRDRFRAWRVRAAARGYKRFARNPVLSEAVGAALLVRYVIPIGPAASRLSYVLVAARRLTTRPLRAVAHRLLQPWLTPERLDLVRRQHVGWSYYTEGFGGLSSRGLSSTLVLKAPGPNGEKGVLYSSFEYNWMRLVANYDARRVLKDYFLVGASSWSPPDYAAFANLSGLSPDPVFIGISNAVDIEHYRLFAPHVRAVPLLASDWIKPDHFAPKPHPEREIDILMVANWLRFKRHWLLFEALARMDRSLRVVLIGRNGEGRTEREIRDEIRAFGVKQNIELITDVPIDAVFEHQCNAKVAAVFSRREGSCVAVAECLFADTPVAVMHDAHIGSKTYINPTTGCITARRRIARDLCQLLERPASIAPRRWAIEHITCDRSSTILNDQLRAYSLAAGLPWTTDITPLQWHSNPRYANSEDDERMKPAVEQLRNEYGVPLI